MSIKEKEGRLRQLLKSKNTPENLNSVFFKDEYQYNLNNIYVDNKTIFVSDKAGCIYPIKQYWENIAVNCHAENEEPVKYEKFLCDVYDITKPYVDEYKEFVAYTEKCEAVQVFLCVPAKGKTAVLENRFENKRFNSFKELSTEFVKYIREDFANMQYEGYKIDDYEIYSPDDVCVKLNEGLFDREKYFITPVSYLKVIEETE